MSSIVLIELEIFADGYRVKTTREDNSVRVEYAASLDSATRYIAHKTLTEVERGKVVRVSFVQADEDTVRSGGEG